MYNNKSYTKKLYIIYVKIYNTHKKIYSNQKNVDQEMYKRKIKKVLSIISVNIVSIFQKDLIQTNY
jgi:hypothetical protein